MCFSTPEQVNQAIIDAATCLHLSRSDLGFTCASRGSCAGFLMLKYVEAEAWIDCRELDASSPFSIPGDAVRLSQLEFQIPARCIVVVEKDAVFQRLLDDRFHELTQAVVVTAKGMPDVATRAFLHALHVWAPSIPFFAGECAVYVFTPLFEPCCLCLIELRLNSQSWIGIHPAC